MSEYDVERSPGMHVVRDGPPEAPPLLLIHGSGFSGASWNPVVPALADHHHVIRVDLPGCGQSPPPPSYDVPAQAGRVAALLDDLGLGPVTAVGHSSGGYLATALAEQRSDLVRSLALISTGPSSDAFLPQPLLLRVLLAPSLGPLLWSRRSDAMIRRGISLTCAGPVDVPDDLVADVRGVPYRAMRTVLRRNGAYLAERSVPERLAVLDIPVLVIFGAADRRWEPASARRYDAVPNARVELLAGVGHVPMLEAPGATSELLLRVTGRGVGECLQIRLEPVAAAAVLGASTELSGTVVSLHEVWGRDAGRVEERLRAATSWDARFTIAAQILGRRLGARRPVDPEVAHTWRRTLTSRGRVRVDGLAAEVGWSRKRLWSRFRAQLGITPKRAARLVRFDHAAHLLAAGQAPASVAADSGYVDQSHLHREVKEFAALTPAAVAAAPWLAIDDIAWPASSPTRRLVTGGQRIRPYAALPTRIEKMISL